MIDRLRNESETKLILPYMDSGPIAIFTGTSEFEKILGKMQP